MGSAVDARHRPRRTLGKKRMREYGSVSIPQEAFIAALRMGEE
jgi:translation elongation factor EF-4